MIELTHMLGRWMAENEISAEGFTLILNFQGIDAAVRFEATMEKELRPLQLDLSKTIDMMPEFQLNGINVRVESPIHDINMPARVVRR